MLNTLLTTILYWGVLIFAVVKIIYIAEKYRRNKEEKIPSKPILKTVLISFAVFVLGNFIIDGIFYLI
jgi:hypothetical protein